PRAPPPPSRSPLPPPGPPPPSPGPLRSPRLRLRSLHGDAAREEQQTDHHEEPRGRLQPELHRVPRLLRSGDERVVALVDAHDAGRAPLPRGELDVDLEELDRNGLPLARRD